MEKAYKVIPLIIIVILIILFKNTSTNEIISILNTNVISIIAFILIAIIATIIFIPGSIIGIVGGIVFGPIIGSVLVIISTTIGSSVAFLISRYLNKFKIVQKIKLTKKFIKMDNFIKRNSTDVLVVTRLLPLFPFNIQNYYYGFTSISFKKFTLVTLLTITPGTILYCYFASKIYYDNENMSLYFVILSSIMIIIYFVSKQILKVKYK